MRLELEKHDFERHRTMHLVTIVFATLFFSLFFLVLSFNETRIKQNFPQKCPTVTLADLM